MTADPITMLQVFFFLLVASAFADVLTVPMGIGGRSFGVSFMTRHSVTIQRAVANRHRFSPLDRRTCGDRFHFLSDCSPSALLVQADRYPNLYHNRLDDAAHSTERRPLGPFAAAQLIERRLRDAPHRGRPEYGLQSGRFLIPESLPLLRRNLHDYQRPHLLRP